MLPVRRLREPSGGGLSLLIAALGLPLGVGVADRPPAPARPADVAFELDAGVLLAMLPPAPEQAAAAQDVAPVEAPATVPPRPSPPASRTQSRAERPPDAELWLRLADCESGFRDRHGRVIVGSARWHLDSGNGYYGGLQFSPESWRWVGGTGLPHEHSPAAQVRRGMQLQRRIGWARAWPLCARRLGLA